MHNIAYSDAIILLYNVSEFVQHHVKYYYLNQGTVPSSCLSTRFTIDVSTGSCDGPYLNTFLMSDKTFDSHKFSVIHCICYKLENIKNLTNLSSSFYFSNSLKHFAECIFLSISLIMACLRARICHDP